MDLRRLVVCGGGGGVLTPSWLTDEAAAEGCWARGSMVDGKNQRGTEVARRPTATTM